jgi:hypothetical protein
MGVGVVKPACFLVMLSWLGCDAIKGLGLLSWECRPFQFLSHDVDSMIAYNLFWFRRAFLQWPEDPFGTTSSIFSGIACECRPS